MELNDQKVNHYNDGFGRFSVFKINGDKVTFSTKMLNSKYYEESKKEGNIIPGLLFCETTPARWMCNIPLVNMVYTIQRDNNWVDLELTADGKEFLITSDSDIKLKFDVNKLEQTGQKHYFDPLMLFTGVSHSQRLRDGTVISLGQDMQYNIILYKIEPQSPHYRQEIAKIPSDKFGLYHSFALTKDYAIIFDPPYYMDMGVTDLMFHNNSIKDYIKTDRHTTTKIHVVRLRDGEVTSFDSLMWSIVFHFGNAW